MGKPSISRLLLAMAISGIFLVPPTDSFAAKNWLEKKLEKLFPSPQHKAPKRRKARPVTKVLTPLTAPVPATKPSQPPVHEGELPKSPEIVSVPKNEPQASAPTMEPPADPVQGPPAPQPNSAGPVEKAIVSSDSKDVEIPETAPQLEAVDPGLPAAVEEAPVPVPRPDPEPQASEALPDDPDLIPLPEMRPDAPASPDNAYGPAADDEPGFLPDARASLKPDPSGKLPEEELACRRRLTALGVDFENHTTEADPAGCSIPYPLIVKSLGSSIDLQPEAKMNCAMTEAIGRFASDIVSPAAKAEYGAALQSVSHASAYVCRPRNGTRRLSEHAFGNALDIASFTLAGGIVIAVEPEPDDNAANFLDKLRAAACGPFKTVLGPGSDEDHALHFHFDLRQRRNGGTFCQ